MTQQRHEKRSTTHDKCFGDDGKVNGEILQSSEANESLLTELKTAIRAGLDSGETEMFAPVQHLEVLKVARRNR